MNKGILCTIFHSTITAGQLSAQNRKWNWISSLIPRWRLFLEKSIVIHLANKFPVSMESDGSSLSSQNPLIYRYPKPLKSSPNFTIYLRSILHYLHIYAYISCAVFSLEFLRPNFLFPLCVPHVPLIATPWYNHSINIQFSRGITFRSHTARSDVHTVILLPGDDILGPQIGGATDVWATSCQVSQNGVQRSGVHYRSSEWTPGGREPHPHVRKWSHGRHSDPKW
jgi:hypothetical protein